MEMKYGLFTGCEDHQIRDTEVDLENLPVKCCARCEHWINGTREDYGFCEVACTCEWDMFSYADDCCDHFVETRDCMDCCHYCDPYGDLAHEKYCDCKALYGDGMKIIDGNEAPDCKHYEVKKCKTCGHLSDLFGDLEDIALCTCYGKCIDDDFVEVPKDKVAVNCEYYYYDPQED